MLYHTAEKYFDMFPEDKTRLSLLREQCESREDIGSRKNLRGHVTGSGIVICDAKVLLIFHGFLKMYLQPGGHYDNDESMMMCAMRELGEETGLIVEPHPWHTKHGGIPLHIDTHAIPENTKKKEGRHYHHDHLYVFHMQGGQRVVLEKKEVEDFYWRPWKELLKEENIGLRGVAQKIQLLELC